MPRHSCGRGARFFDQQGSLHAVHEPSPRLVTQTFEMDPGLDESPAMDDEVAADDHAAPVDGAPPAAGDAPAPDDAASPAADEESE